jgi:hypothetical protein
MYLIIKPFNKPIFIKKNISAYSNLLNLMKIKIFFLFNLLLLFSNIYSQVNLVDNKGKILIMESSASKGTGALRDSNGNLKANNFINSFQTSTTSGTVVALTVTSKQIQEFTGLTPQILTLPVTTTLATGHQFYIVNNSTATITLNSSGGDLVVSAAAASRVVVTCILSSDTTAASWTADLSTLSGTAPNVSGIVLGANGGTGVDNSGKTITIGGNLTTTGAFTTNLTATANTALTLPITGTLATLKDITDANNAFKTPLAITTGNYTITSSDYTVLCNASNGAFLLTLPPATSSKDKIIIIKKIDVTNNPINFSQSIYITDILIATSINYPKTIKIQSNGTNWYIIN